MILTQDHDLDVLSLIYFKKKDKDHLFSPNKHNFDHEIARIPLVLAPKFSLFLKLSLIFDLFDDLIA